MVLVVYGFPTQVLQRHSLAQCTACFWQRLSAQQQHQQQQQQQKRIWLQLWQQGSSSSDQAQVT
jgi:hypothetical protein